MRIRACLNYYAANPDSPGHDVTPLVGRSNEYRLRSGDWRVIFDRHPDHLMVNRVAHRREVYR